MLKRVQVSMVEGILNHHKHSIRILMIPTLMFKPCVTGVQSGRNSDLSQAYNTASTAIVGHSVAKPHVKDIQSGQNFELSETYIMNVNDTSSGQCNDNVKPCVIDIQRNGNSESPLKYNVGFDDVSTGQCDVKPCVIDIQRNGNSELPQTCNIGFDDTNVGHCDVKPCVKDVQSWQHSEIPVRYKSIFSERNKEQVDVKPCLSDLQNGENFHLTKRYNVAFSETSVHQCDDKTCVTDVQSGQKSKLLQKSEKFTDDIDVKQNDIIQPCVTNCHSGDDCGGQKSSDLVSNDRSVGQDKALLSKIQLRDGEHSNLFQTCECFLNGADVKYNDIKPCVPDLQTDTEFADETNIRQRDVKLHLTGLSTSFNSETKQNEGHEDFAFKYRYTESLSGQEMILSPVPPCAMEKSVYKCGSPLNTTTQNKTVCNGDKNCSDARGVQVVMNTFCTSRPVSSAYYQHDSEHLQLHVRTQSGEKPFRCAECGKGFGLSSNLQRHIRTHSDEKAFSCDECGKSFSDSTNLKRHHFRIHIGENPFKCDKCGKSFGSNSDLQRHIMIHTGVKPFKCGECRKSFHIISDLQRHLRTHTGEKPFKCDECLKCFGERGDLRKHIILEHTLVKNLSNVVCVGEALVSVPIFEDIWKHTLVKSL